PASCETLGAAWFGVCTFTIHRPDGDQAERLAISSPIISPIRPHLYARPPDCVRPSALTCVCHGRVGRASSYHPTASISPAFCRSNSIFSLTSCAIRELGYSLIMLSPNLIASFQL